MKRRANAREGPIASIHHQWESAAAEAAEAAGTTVRRSGSTLGQDQPNVLLECVPSNGVRVRRAWVEGPTFPRWACPPFDRRMDGCDLGEVGVALAPLSSDLPDRGHMLGLFSREPVANDPPGSCVGDRAPHSRDESAVPATLGAPR